MQHKRQHLIQNIVHEEVRRKVTDVYDITGQELGTGISGTVRVCTHKETKMKYALKTLQLHQMKDDEDAMKQLKEEIGILKVRTCRHNASFPFLSIRHPLTRSLIYILVYTMICCSRPSTIPTSPVWRKFTKPPTTCTWSLSCAPGGRCWTG